MLGKKQSPILCSGIDQDKSMTTCVRLYIVSKGDIRAKRSYLSDGESNPGLLRAVPWNDKQKY